MECFLYLQTVGGELQPQRITIDYTDKLCFLQFVIDRFVAGYQRHWPSDLLTSHLVNEFQRVAFTIRICLQLVTLKDPSDVRNGRDVKRCIKNELFRLFSHDLTSNGW